MSEALSFEVKLDDGVSAPAKNAANSLEKLFNTVNAIGRALGGADSGMGKLAGQMQAMSKIKPPSLDGVNNAMAKLKTYQTSVLKDSYDRSERQWKSFFNVMNRTPLALQERGGNANGPGAFGQLVQWAGGAFGEKGASGLLNIGEGLAGAESALAGLGTSLSGVAAGAAVCVAALAAVAAAVVAIGVALGTMAVKAAMAFTTMALEAGRFREDTLSAMTAMLKSGDEAKKVWAIATKFAADTPFETNTIMDAFKGLLAGGFKTNELEGWMRTIADIATVKGADAIPELVRGLSRLRSEGKLTGETLEVLRASGLNMKDVAKIAGVSDPSKLIGLEGSKAEDAIRKAIEQSFGGASKAAGGTLTGLWSTLMSAPGDLFVAAFAASEKANTGVTAFYNTLKAMVQDALKWIGGDGGRKVVEAINAIGSGLNAIATLAREFGSGMLDGLIAGLQESGASKQFESLSKINWKDTAAGARQLGMALGNCLAAAVWLSTALAAIGSHEWVLWTLGVFAVITAIAVGVLTAALGLLVLALAAVGLVLLVLLIPILSIFVVFAVILCVVLLVIAAALTAVVVACLAIAAIFMLAAWAVLYFLGIVDSAPPGLDGLKNAFSGLGDTITSSLVGAFQSAFDGVTAAAAELGAAAMDSFMGAFQPNMQASIVPSGGFGLGGASVPPQQFSWGSAPAPNAQNTTNNSTSFNINMSGLGLDLPALAALIRSECAQALRQAAGT